ncbi:MAG: hypothetical protein LBI54_04075 [Lachnospiraceae bacterium]|jgi:hypothetical protein|nr:hypothetical protein [Lachnospiraceae bacterium]
METSSITDLRHLTWKQAAGSVASDGVYLKAEEGEDGVKYYYKLSNYDAYRGVFGHEAVNELIAYRLGKMLGFNVPAGMLQKSLVRVDEREFETFVFKSLSFRPVAASRESFDKYYENNRLSAAEAPLDFCQRLGWADDIYKMFVFDYLIINRDRHGANLEVFKNGEKYLSPLFDNGASFVFAYTDKEADLDAFDELADLPVNNFIGTRSLQKNLALIDKKIVFGELPPDFAPTLFADLDEALPEKHREKIASIISKRWENVKDFRAV